ncbi:MAG: hypothetical protein Q8L48_32545 [Archangium sp.]|nr:hypothetical protein [Archangium sp.]
MTRRLVVLTTLTALALLFSPRDVSASPPAPCPPPLEEALALFPTFATFNGESVTRSPTTGRFETDAGFAFDHELVDLRAVGTSAPVGCSQTASAVELDLTDPFTGVVQTVTLEAL